MNSAELLSDAFGRIRDIVDRVPEGLSVEQLATRPYAGGNSIAWLLWHMTRVQDDHVAAAADVEQLWDAEGWFDRFSLPFNAESTGYGHGPDEVAAVRIDAELLRQYHAAVSRHTIDWIGRLTDSDLCVVVDDSWDPPVTLGVRLVSVISDSLQHAGQAAYIRGMLLA